MVGSLSKRRQRSAFAVWVVAELVYLVAVAGRSSFGVAGLDAMERFSIPAATLSLFVVVQLAVYSLAQIPVGMLLDRVGVRRVILAGGVFMACGQMALAVADSLPLALAARVLIGLGDATAFASVVRLVPVWFAPHAAPMMTQLTGVIGQFGQVISSFPFAWVLHQYGWQPAFLTLGAVGAIVAVIAGVGVRNRPERPSPDTDEARTSATQGTGRGDDVVDDQRTQPSIPSFMSTFREPGAWLGFWTHYVGGLPPMVFMLLWGVPFLQVAGGMSPAAAAAILVIQPAAGIVAGPLIGRLTAAHPLRRTWLVYGSVALTVAAWLPLLLRDTPPPTWMVVVLLCVLSLSGAASGISFDFIRTFVHPARVGTANGLANMGGFSATFVTAWLIGVVLDFLASDGGYTALVYRQAMAVQGIVLMVGLIGFAVSKRYTRRKMAAQGTVVPSLHEVMERYRR
ncbi:MAG: MFS transporter [Ancrocorticia sp.]